MSRVTSETALETGTDSPTSDPDDPGSPPAARSEDANGPAAPSGRIPTQRGAGAHRGDRRSVSPPDSPAHGTPIARGTPGRHRRPTRPPRRRRALLGSGLAVLAGLAVLVVVAAFLHGGSRTPAPSPTPGEAAHRAPVAPVALPPPLPSALPRRPSTPAPAAPRPAPPVDLFSTAGSLWAFSRGLAGFSIDDGDVENGGLTPTAVASPTVPGREAVMVVVPPGAKRSEVQPSAGQHITAGQHLAFGLSYYLPPGFPVDTSGFQVVWQLHDGGTNTSPPVALEITDGHLWLSNVGDHLADLGPVRAGSNLVVGLDIRFARGAGTVTVVRDGQTLVTNLAPPRGTMIDAFDYLKAGVYKHEDDDDPTARLYINDLRICPGGDGGTVPPPCRDLVGS